MRFCQKTTMTILFLISIQILLLQNGIYLHAQDAPEKKIPVAVWDFDSKGVSEIVVSNIAQRFGNRLVETGIFDVVERDKRDAILDEQGFQQTGCTSTECVIDAGKLLNVQKMITGSIGQVGLTYTTDLRIIDIESGRIEKTVSRDYKGDIDGLLEFMDILAKEISGIIIEEPTSPWWYVAGGAVLVGGAAAYFLLQPEKVEEKPLKGPPPLPE